MNRENEFKRLLLNLAEYYSYKITMGSLSMMIEDLDVLSVEELKSAMRKWRQDPKNRVFPLPAQLIQLAHPEKNISDTDVARTVAFQVWALISKLGYNNPDRAKEELGDLGWSVVERMGGWVSICQSASEDQKGMFIAQCRDLTEATIRLQKSGKLDHKFSLTEFASEEDKAEIQKLTEMVVKRIEVPQTLEVQQ